MSPGQLLHAAIMPALRLLPPRMDTPAARTLMLAIAYQESGMRHRRQIVGPARGYWQFEAGGGVRGVLRHPASKLHAKYALDFLDYDPETSAADCHAVIEHNDVLAAVFARLLLWTDAEPLPTDAQGAWELYLRTWRPGRPHPDKWAANFQKAKDAINAHA